VEEGGTSVDRVTALLAQAAVTVLVLIGLVAILGYTHARAYRSGYCATAYCTSAEASSWWPFGQVETADRDPGRNSDPLRGGNDPFGPSRYGSGNSWDEPGWRDSNDPLDRDSGTGATVTYDTGRYGSGSYDAPGRYDTRPSSGSGGSGSGSSGWGFNLPSSSRYSSRYFGSAGERICAMGSQESGNAARLARCWLNVGDAYQAVGRVNEAREAWDQSLVTGSYGGGAQAALMAQQRLQTALLQLSCPTTARSLARIAYGSEQSDDSGDTIELISRQRALTALGYYSGPVDGSYGPVTRRSVRDFQREMGFDQTGALTPQETVTLMCHAALNARDAESQNLLGIMFATGLGLEQNIDSALEWLDTAAERGNGSANFNLALIYGTGTVQGSYRLCGLVESPERADSYLRRAADLGHERAQRLRREFIGGGEPGERWTRISQALLAEAERSGDRFYIAWQQRVDEARRENGNDPNQPGCYQAALTSSLAVPGGGSSTD
tara:strand:+ start:3948 stop:5435 length:1488 start_codon:yes stop_codon:yes gene_type:complete